MSIIIKNLKKTFGNLVLYDNFNEEFEKNKINVLIGPSGCGKTTLINIVANIENYEKGIVEGVDIKKISYIFQEPSLINWLTVYENIEFVLSSLYEKKEIKEIIQYYLKLVNLYDFKDYYPDNLSGGMKQRVAIARAFSYPSNILLMDEPFKGLDVTLKNEIMKSFIKMYKKEEKTVLYVTHNIEDALTIGHNIYILCNNPVSTISKICIKNPLNNRDLSSNYFIELKEKISLLI